MLSQDWTFHFPYTRTTGPVVGRFLAGLKERRIEGLRTVDGRVQVPPTGYDPATGEALTEWVEVAAEGTVEAWTWIEAPLKAHPRDVPFAFATIRLDGADTALVHVVDAPSEDALREGLRVRARWADEPAGTFFDLAGFEPSTGSEAGA